MKIDFARELMNLKGKPMTLEGEPGTLGLVAATALIAQGADETLTGEQKLKCFRLARRISDADGPVVDITVEDAALIKERIARLYPPLVSGQAWHMIDGGQDE